NETVFGALARTLTVNRLRAGNDYFLDGQIFFPNEFEYLRRAERIHVHVFRHLRHVTAIRRLMKNYIDIPQDVLNGLTITQIAPYKLGILVDPRWFPSLVRIWFEVVEDSHPPAFVHEQIGDVRTDQTRSAGD